MSNKRRKTGCLAFLMELLVLAVFQAGSNAAPLTGKLIVTLPFHSSVNRLTLADDSGLDSSIGVDSPDFDMGNGRVPRLVGVDWNGSFYMDEPAGSGTNCTGYTELKCFNRAGRLIESWEPTIADRIEYVRCDKAGRIWCVASCADVGGETMHSIGIDLFVYQHGTRRPTIDLRPGITIRLRHKIWRMLNGSGLMGGLTEPDPGEDIEFDNLEPWEVEPGDGDVKLDLGVPGGWWRDVGDVGSDVLSLTLSRDCSHLISSKLYRYRGGWGDAETTRMGPDGITWRARYVFSRPPVRPYNQGEWKDMQIYTGHSKRPLLVFNSGDKSGDELGAVLARRYPAIVDRDACGHTYIVMCFTNMGGDYHELTVYNRSGKLIGIIPWMNTTTQTDRSWVQPVPDGSGFYRLQLTSSAAKIYFYRLPRD